MKVLKYSFLITLALFLFACSERQSGNLVHTVEEFERAVRKAGPGDEIIIANGTYSDTELLFTGKGTKENPIILRAEEPGKVVLSGLSNLRLAGEYLQVSGLVFKNGYTPTSAVISFRRDEANLANNCRVTQCVIDNYNNPERFESDIWVVMYGKNNIFDHNTLIGKRNLGVTMAVRLDTEESRENGHQIRYNYFGPRQNLGSNGGETLRIGTSHYSLTNSGTVVENNYFDRCDGEHEIISNKSGNNTYRGNVFFECRGTLTMRHGQHTLVEGNYFLGNRKANTGGIRVINEYQTVRNNYLCGLTGYRFRGALVVMNGVPNSPLNRYNQVVDSRIEYNIVVNSDHIQLCAGSDAERSATPIGTSITGNIFMSKTNLRPFTIYDDISGISFNNNFINREADVQISKGFEEVSYVLAKNSNGLWAPDKKLIEAINFGPIKLPVTKAGTGAGFYPKSAISVPFRSGRTIEVAPGTNTLIEAVDQSNPGDILRLQNSATYLLTKDLLLKHPVSIQCPAGEKATIQSQKQAFFRIENEGALELENIKLDGSKSPDHYGNSVVATSRYSMNRNYKLFVRNCTITDLDVNHSFNFLRIARHTMADTVLIENSSFSNITGDVLSMARETEDLGIYNVENVIIKNSTFKDIQGAVANIYRGGTDESTFGPIVSLSGNKFINSGHGKRNKIHSSMKFHGVQLMQIDSCQWLNSAPLKLHLTNGEPIAVISNSTFKNSGAIEANKNSFLIKNVKQLK